MLYGGARSGKTFLLVACVVVRALRHPGSRHLIARLRFAHAKLSIWLDTLPKVIAAVAPAGSYTVAESDHYIRFKNGSEVWVDGLDDKDRVEKILGREYATIFFNEVSQIGYDTITTVATRLSQQVEGCTVRAYYDLNPTGKLHWANQVFIVGVQPDGTPTPEGYAYLRINPRDNAENLPEGYIDDVLAKLPEHKRKRFLDGEWADPEGVVFADWEEIDEIPERVKEHGTRAYGLDFGFSVDPAALVSLWYVEADDELYLDELIYQTGLTNQDLGRAMTDLIEPGIPVYADSAEPKSIEELRQQGYAIEGAAKGPDSVRAGIDWLLARRVCVTRRSVNIWNERGNYTWRMSPNGIRLPKPIDDFNHTMDAIRYGATEWIMRSRGRIAEWSAGALGL